MCEIYYFIDANIGRMAIVRNIEEPLNTETMKNAIQSVLEVIVEDGGVIERVQSYTLDNYCKLLKDSGLVDSNAYHLRVPMTYIEAQCRCQCSPMWLESLDENIPSDYYLVKDNGVIHSINTGKQYMLYLKDEAHKWCLYYQVEPESIDDISSLVLGTLLS